MQVIRRFDRHDGDPFFAWVSHVGPTTPAIPGAPGGLLGAAGAGRARPRRLRRGGDRPVATLPSWNHRNDETEPPFLRDREPRRAAARSTSRFQRRIEALQSVDRSVAATVRALREQWRARPDPRSSSPPTTATSSGSTATSGSACPTRSRSGCRCWSAGPASRPVRRTDQVATTTDLTRTIVDAGRSRAVPPARRRLDGAGADRRARAGAARRSCRPAPPSSRRVTRSWSEPDDQRLALPRLPRRPLDLRPLPRSRWRGHAGLRGALRPRRRPLPAAQPGHRPGVRGGAAAGRARAAELADCVGSACHPAWARLPGPGG